MQKEEKETKRSSKNTTELGIHYFALVYTILLFKQRTQLKLYLVSVLYLKIETVCFEIYQKYMNTQCINVASTTSENVFIINNYYLFILLLLLLLLFIVFVLHSNTF